jgi:hypothetical protein
MKEQKMTSDYLTSIAHGYIESSKKTGASTKTDECITEYQTIALGMFTLRIVSQPTEDEVAAIEYYGVSSILQMAGNELIAMDKEAA